MSRFKTRALNKKWQPFLEVFIKENIKYNLTKSRLAREFLEAHPECPVSENSVRCAINSFFARTGTGKTVTKVTDKAIKDWSEDTKLDLLEGLEEHRREINELKKILKRTHNIDTPIRESKPVIKTINKPVEENTEGTHLVIGCVHMPFHHKGTWNAFLEIANSLGDELKSVNLIGDITDMHSISRHAKGKITIPGLTLWQEYEETNKELNKLEEAVGKDVNKHFLYGNHEDWYNQHMAEVDNAKLGGETIASPAEAMSYRKRGFTVQTNWKDAHITLGDMELIHGTYCNVHSPKKHLDVMKRNVMYVHTHSVGVYTERDLCSYNIGWGGDRDSKAFGYMTRIQKEKWRNGFASVYVDSNGKSHPNQLLWTNGGIHFRGKLYK